MNAISASMHAALADGIHQARQDDSVGSVLLTGAGGNFTSGNDIGLFVQGAEREHQTSPAVPFLEAVLELQKPLVACVSGHAVGIGATVLIHCDFVVATDDARLRFPFVDLGLCPEFASTLLLQNLVGRGKASEWLLLGAPIPAAEAHLAGLINRVLPTEIALEEALSIAKRLAAKPRCGADLLGADEGAKALLQRQTHAPGGQQGIQRSLVKMTNERPLQKPAHGESAAERQCDGHGKVGGT